MSLFYFILKTGQEKIPDREGLEFPDQDTARAHAEIVARELMRNRELKTRTWRIEVRDEDLQPCFELLFAAEDNTTIAHLGYEQRHTVEMVSARTARLFDAFDQVKTSISDVRETLARADNLMRQLRAQNR